MGSSPLRSAPLFVLNTYQVLPLFAMDGSWVYSTSPSIFKTTGFFSSTVACEVSSSRPSRKAEIKERRTVFLFPPGI